MTLGQIAYEAYCEHQDWKAFDGKPIPEWKDVREDIQQAWEIAAVAAARHAMKVLR